ncbi:ABC transporter ATP-binding protein [Micromonospora rifamycinica]|uniref:ATP-binding cassette, subfamily B n=1 Tax=Micromonospora rifamycinica TaxID=291594 RepID=A0A109IP60_9ACTN|nr:ABC transporter ATP-binding protein [Micromonospora rifamycinica]KWV34156.1 hypothetical protein AWV63_03205 [Micromonospora rifamycinica]SCG58851.1 ATP-binding cassette, subfamily B [Micromonospora rifamycinica]
MPTADQVARGDEGARPPWRGWGRRARRRAEAGRQLVHLSRYAGRPLVATLLSVHVVAGLMPMTFGIGVGLALSSLAGDPDRSAAAGWLAVALVAFVVQQLLAPLQRALSQVVSRRIDSYCIARYTEDAAIRASLPTLERADVADLLNHAEEEFDTWILTPGGATEGALALVARYAQLVSAVTVAAVTAGWPVAVAAATVALVVRRGHSIAFHRWGALIVSFEPVRRRLTYLRELATTTRAAKEIRTLGLLDWLDQRYEDASRDYLDPLWSWRRRVYGVPFLVYAGLGLIATLAAFLLLAGSVGAAGDAPVAEVAIGVQAVAICVRFGQMFPESDMKMVHGRAAWEAILAFERLCREDTDDDGTGRNRVVTTPQRLIALEQVTFGYQPDRPVLRGLDLRLPVGTSTALVGVNGAGKTTLVKLLAGLYQPAGGSVTVDGVDLRRLDPEAWQRTFAVVFQDFVRYEATLRENVAMGSVEHRDDDEGVTAELRRVGLGYLLDELPLGLETPLTRALPGGQDLSGGQWQRVALARALFAVRHGASVLVLDEPTAQLDARGEAEFYDTFLDLTRGVTSLVISHRFSSVRQADRIVVLADGRIEEAGSHDELIASGGRYAGMFAVQARRFADGAATSTPLGGPA